MNLLLVASNTIKPSIILPSYDLATVIRDAGISTSGGFQTPLEKDCLEILLRGTAPVTVCPARHVETMRLPGAWRTAMADGRLTLLSPFGPSVRRATARTAEERNRFVLARAGAVLALHATPGGRTEALVRPAIAAGKPVATLDHPANGHLVALGACPVTAATVVGWYGGLATVDSADTDEAGTGPSSGCVAVP